MRRFTFTPADLAVIRHERYHHPHPHVQQKFEVLWLKSQGCTQQEIARLAAVSRRRVQRYLDEYADGGLARLREVRWPGRAPTPWLRTPPPWRTISWSTRHARPARAPSSHRPPDRGATRLDPGPCLLKKTLDLRWRKLGTLPAKADPAEQADFLKTKLRPRLRQAERGQRTVFFVDAAHFIYGPFLGYLCCLVRWLVPAPSGRKRYNVLAALNAITHEVIRVTNHSYINAESVCALRRQLAARGGSRPLTVVLDNARYR